MIFPARRPLGERFWEKVARGVPDECWEWQATRNEHGYGTFMYTKGHPRKAHRVAWELQNGSIPEGLCVCHHCDNPPCVNPAHLFLGTIADNNRDKWAKGRGRPYPRRLTWEQAQEVRRRYQAGEPQIALCREFGVSPATMNRVVHGHTYTKAFV